MVPMTTNDAINPPHGVLVGVDGSPAALEAVRWGADEASARRCPLTLVSAWTPPPRMLTETEERHDDDIQQAREQLAAALQTARDHGSSDIDVRPALRGGLATDVILELANDADLVVLGSRGFGGFRDLLLGSVSRGVAERSSAPVVVHRPSSGTEGREAGRVVLGLEVQPGEAPAGQDEILSFAFETAARRELPLTAVHCVEPFQAPRMMAPNYHEDRASEAASVLATTLEPWRQRFAEVDVRPVIERHRASATLVDLSDGAALVVVGATGRRNLAGMTLGSVSHALLHHAKSPVAVVPHVRR
jgi:nucleotide-binding universal stress UspA family protein